MKKTLLISLLTLAAVLPATASAGTVTLAGGVLTFDAAPGEQNYVIAYATNDCAGLAAPCLSFSDSYAITPPAGCAGPGFFDSSIVCPQPSSIVMRLGDRDDVAQDWDGPSVIDGGPGNDGVFGNAGDEGSTAAWATTTSSAGPATTGSTAATATTCSRCSRVATRASRGSGPATPRGPTSCTAAAAPTRSGTSRGPIR